jgi:hypothetical protein
MSIVRAESQICHGMAQYDPCSSNNGCACFHLAGATDIGICSHRLLVDCSELVACERSTNHCYEPDHECVHHPLCHNLPVCYPVPSYNQQLCPPVESKRTNSVLQIQVEFRSYLKVPIHRAHTAYICN